MNSYLCYSTASLATSHILWPYVHSLWCLPWWPYQNGINRAVANDAGNSNAEKESTGAFHFLPPTKDIMKDPVVNLHGESFERSAVTAWDKRDKITGLAYYPNRALKAIIDEEVMK